MPLLPERLRCGRCNWLLRVFKIDCVAQGTIKDVEQLLDSPLEAPHAVQNDSPTLLRIALTLQYPTLQTCVVPCCKEQNTYHYYWNVPSYIMACGSSPLLIRQRGKFLHHQVHDANSSPLLLVESVHDSLLVLFYTFNSPFAEHSLRFSSSVWTLIMSNNAHGSTAVQKTRCQSNTQWNPTREDQNEQGRQAQQGQHTRGDHWRSQEQQPTTASGQRLKRKSHEQPKHPKAQKENPTAFNCLTRK